MVTFRAQGTSPNFDGFQCRTLNSGVFSLQRLIMAPKTTPSPSDEPSQPSKRVATSRGPNWGDDESMKLVEAYQIAMAEKDGLVAHFYCSQVFRNGNASPSQ